MQKLQIFAYKSRGVYQLGLVRNHHHLRDLLGEPGHRALILTKPLDSSQAYGTLQVWKQRFSRPWAPLWWQVAKKTSYNIIPQSGDTLKLPSRERVQEALEKILEVLSGRLLSEGKLISLLRQDGYWPSELSFALDYGVFAGRLRQFPGMITGPWGVKVCSRCRSEAVKEVPCLNCGDPHCLLCSECLTMGEHRSCSTVLATTALPEKLAQSKVAMRLDYELTRAQSDAAEELLDFWDQGQNKALVWAACGAGKTEVTFPLIQRVLEEGYQVLFAIPRQDIVREMAERLQSSFPEVEVAAHYGGQPWLAPGSLVVATTHQVLHFYRRFQLAILDEVDAFPYQGNEMLRMALARSLTPQGKLVEMTATPSDQKQYERIITIPARYHGFPLPEPQLIQQSLPHWSELEPSNLPPLILETLQKENHPWLVFVPTIAACDALYRVLSSLLGPEVGLCHSKVPSRSSIIRSFREGRLKILVTTSVLERGVNFPQVGVVVLYADHGIFNVSTLVQIAGRVGRTAEYPRGTVLFIGRKKTGSMQKSLELIRQLNTEARKRGLLYASTA